MMVAKSPESSGLMVGTSPFITWPVEPSMVMTSPLFSVCPAPTACPPGIVDADGAGARHAGLAHAARHDGGMGGHAAAGGEDAFGGMHAVDILGGRLDPHQDDGAALRPSAFSASSESKTISPDSRARRGRQALADDLALGAGIEGRMQQLVERCRIDAAAPPRRG